LLLRALTASILHVDRRVNLLAVVYLNWLWCHGRLRVWVVATKLVLQKAILIVTLWLYLSETVDNLLIFVAIFISLLELYCSLSLLGSHFNINFEL
jgi:hypothetical protein